MNTQIFFKPHVGRYYNSSGGIFGCKVLVVGDSHYCSDCSDCGDSNRHPECVNFTGGVILDYLDATNEGKWKKTFSTFINSFYNRSSNINDRKSFMDSIAFYNFLQVSAGSSPYETTNYNYSEERHRLAYMEVLSILTPNYVIVWGSKVREQLELMKTLDIGLFYSAGGHPEYIFVCHPSQGYGRKYHHDLFEKNGMNLK
jgi:hypothetical protein